jgi:membrane protease YdiL (CAAX protease family)
MLGPAVAGITMTAVVDGVAGLRHLLAGLRRWRVGGRWYAVALLTAPLVSTSIALALSLTSPAFLPGIVTADDKLSLTLLALVGALTVPVFEEIGWTGFVMPRLLLRHGIVATGLLMGVLWGLWHLPLFAGNASSSGSVHPGLLLVALLFAWFVPFRVLMVWLYDRTQSLLLVMLMHAPLVASMYVLRAESASPEETFASLIGSGAAYWAIVVVVAIANHGRLRRRGSGVPLMARTEHEPSRG